MLIYPLNFSQRICTAAEKIEAISETIISCSGTVITLSRLLRLERVVFWGLFLWLVFFIYMLSLHHVISLCLSRCRDKWTK